jgi:dipeptidyl aminopeptidase/acylaminoacyl peptidase
VRTKSPANFVPRVTVPALLINGQDDFSASPESQARFFELLGTRPDRTAHKGFDGGHVPDDRQQMVRVILDWYDKYLGPIK